MVAIAREELARHGVRAMIELLKENNPAYMQAEADLQPHQMIERHGEIKGYSRCLLLLTSLSELIPVYKEPTATFEPPTE